MYNFYIKNKERLPRRTAGAALLFILAILQVSAGAFAQQVTLLEKNVPLITVFEKISSQTGYDFLVSSEMLRQAKPVTIAVTKQSLKTALDKIFTGQPLNYTIQEKMVVVSRKDLTGRNVPKLTITGKVTDTTGAPLAGATVKVTGRDEVVLTKTDGTFTIMARAGDDLTISYIGYRAYTFRAAPGLPFQQITLYAASSKLEEVNVVSTGYQTIPRDRATGSFTQLDNALINRSISTNILDRLNGVSSGILFNNNGAHQFGQANIEVRGRATLFSNPNPLIVIDNFPYDGDPGNINPNDVESITILKDAAAASAWGARSGNGVIVITTKKGHLDSPPTISFSASMTVAQKPDLYYMPQLTSAEYIGVEQFLFNKGAYDNTIGNGYSALSPAVEIFLARRSGTISAADSAAAINKLKGYDSRQQILKYYYRPAISQQYQAGISGGGASQKYFVSAGYDKNLNSYVNSDYSRVTLNASNTYYLIKNRLELFTHIVYTGSTSASGPVINTTAYPYDQLADASGNHLAVANTLRLSYANTAGNGKLLNWQYKPLDELDNGYSNTNTDVMDYRVDASVAYKILPGLKALALYSFEKGTTESNNLNDLQSYYTRNLINTFTEIDPVTGSVTYPLPVGGILYNGLTTLTSENGRFQLNYDHVWGKQAVSAIAGTEIKDYETYYSTYGLYGYNPATASNQNAAVNYTANYPYFYGFNTSQIPTGTTELGTANRFFSYYFNGAYTYEEKYIASFSARRDESNLFGVAANQKGVPLWSSGLSWIASKENFYKMGWLPLLKFRATFGYTGNVNTSLSAYLTAAPGLTAQTYNAPYSQIVNPPNPSLQWEKDRTYNLGMDFAVKGNRLSGSIDLWRKDGMNLIGNSPIAPQTGITLYTGNSANTSTRGADIQLNSVNLNGRLKWYTTLLYNYDRSLVTAYKVSNGTNYNVVSANYNNPLQGYPYYAIFSFRYAGLTAAGDPQGYLNGKVSTDYTGITNSTNRANLVYNGAATPTSFGSLRNTFMYRGVDLSFNIVYKLGYVFRRTSLNNDALYSAGGNNYQMADYEARWQKPGDELHTNVPALIYPSSISRTLLYTYSNVLVDNADHIRLQDLRLGYTFGNKPAFPFKNLNVFTYISNIGILWRANKYHIDPDYPTGIPAVRTFAIGLKADL